ncbi:LarC family nickel insertion protein [Desulfosporosinus sp. SB140]|uniref:LarC family nickel insertion protein n=1 Tax=Desulfosporosinus paludis TaxID=3115649 RepID=UPI00388DD47A
MRILYWDTFAGISGDMALGSLIALGADSEAIVEQLHSMGLTEFKLDIRSRQVQGIQATDIDVIIHDHLDKHHHADDQSEHEHHHHHDRRLPDIQKMILSGTLSERSQKNALQVFNVLAEAEAQVHGTTLDQVHFHEVGAVDSLVDIVGTCIALDQLNIEEIRISTLPWSKGFVQCAHGTLPLPAPATLMLLRGFKFRDSGITGELITPTGAALIRALAQQTEFPEMVIHNVGYGSGKNDYGIPSLLRGVIGEI